MKELFRNLFPNRIKKKRRRNGRKGAVTIFLTIVLVPTIVFAAVFTDVSRVQYSKTMAESAGDLALDSLIARYDEHLEQYYGMVASCQDIDSFYQKSMDYFAGMMRAEGIKDANVAQIVDYVNQVMKDGNISDFLRTELDSAGLNISDMVSHLDRNAALLEDQIVEFMKYRGPIEISKKLVDRLLEKGPDNVMGDLEDASKNEPVVQEKKEYAQAESDFLVQGGKEGVGVAEQGEEDHHQEKDHHGPDNGRHNGEKCFSRAEIMNLHQSDKNQKHTPDFGEGNQHMVKHWHKQKRI